MPSDKINRINARNGQRDDVEIRKGAKDPRQWPMPRDDCVPARSRP
jgi:hypothetical protein